MRIELRGDLAVFTMRSGCGMERQRTVVLPEGQTLEERLAALRKRFPSAEVEVEEEVTGE